MLIIHRKSIMLMHRPQTPQPGFGSITLLQKFIPHFKILDPRLDLATGRERQLTTGKRATRLLVLNLPLSPLVKPVV